MAGNRYYGYHGSPGKRRGTEPGEGLFGWTIFLFLLIGFVFLCWMGSYYIFANPEKPANYRLLLRLKKIEAPQRFEVTGAPRGEFLKPGQLLERYGSMTSSEIRRANESLLRNFLRNYHQNRELVPYTVGTYRVLGATQLSSGTFCPTGLAALMQAVEQPEILIEQIFPCDEASLPSLTKAIVPGLEIRLEKPLDLSAVIHVARMPDNRMILTTMPLLYGHYGEERDHPSFSLIPPGPPNLEAPLPVMGLRRITECTEGRARSSGTPGRLSRIAEESLPAEQATASPSPSPSNTPLPKPTPTSSPSNAVPRTSQPTPETRVARALPVNVPAVLPALPAGAPMPPPLSTPEPQIAKALPAGTPFASFSPNPKAVLASPTPSPGSSPTPKPTPLVKPTAVPSPSPQTSPISVVGQTAWPIYEPGKMPRGRLVETSDAGELNAHGVTGERHYLKGRFTVTASGNGRAVLRPLGALPGISTGSKVRIIVEYPSGENLPSEGMGITRDNLRPFQITSIKKGDDGQINIYAREVTRGQ